MIARPILEPPVGTVLLDRFKVLGFLAKGGMGTVYMGTQLRMDRPVAIKFLRAKQKHSAKRFQREVFVGSQLSHPNLVTVYDYGETEDGELFMVMEYLHGELLSRALLRENNFDFERCVHIAIQLARALRSMHDLGVIHRDIKPENVMIQPDEEGLDMVKLFDFGLVRASASGCKAYMPYAEKRLTNDGSISGTPGYVAPEQAAGDPPDERVDIYALGAVMFQMVTGRRPFAGGSLLEVLTKQVQSVRPTIQELRPSCPVALQNIIKTCLRKRPEERYPSTEPLLADLRGFSKKSLGFSLPFGRQKELER